VDETLRDELLDMAEVDQRARRDGEPETMMRVDREHTERMRAIVAQHGWPGRSLVGEEGAQAAWLLVQHADADPGFQAACLERLREAVEAREAPPDQLAYLGDRVAVGAGEPQVYGTQFRETIDEDGETVLEPFPLEDPEAVDALRAEVGLGPLDDYRRELAERR
jgi:uncharacterized protein DUF6624